MRGNERIFYNYGNFINNNKHLFSNKQSVISLIHSQENFNKYTDALLEGLEEEKIKVIRPLFNHQRNMLLEEAANISTSDMAAGFAVTFFPILADIYNEDILHKAIIHHYTDKPLLTVPKMSLLATVYNSNGTEKSLPFPRARYLIRAEPEEIRLLPNSQNNLFSLSKSYPEKVNDKLSVVNQRFFSLENIAVKIQNTKLSKTEIKIIPLIARPDLRGQVVKEFEFEDFNNDLISGKLIGNINWDKGIFYYSCSFESKTDYEFTLEYVDSLVLFTARSGEIGRVKIKLQMQGWDIKVDVKEDFEFELDAETMQDYTDIYNIDLIKNISHAIKTQTLLNRDHDIAKLLRSVEPEIKTMNTYEMVDFAPIQDTFGILSPGFLSSIYQTLVPRFSVVSRFMYVNYNAIPQYILTGVRMAAVLENLQEYAVSLPTYKEGMAGYDNLHAMNIHANVFLKSVILTSPAIEPDKAYLLYKPDLEEIHDNSPTLHLTKEEKLRSTVLADIVYQPLYIIEEITNSQKRTFIRSRSTFELFRPEGVGLVEMKSLSQVLTQNTILNPRII